jgi:hypothetical protein
MTPRKHADLIRAWADGAEIQRLCHGIVGCAIWVDEPHPDWATNEVYRLKPVPKADYSERGFIRFFNLDIPSVPVRITFDGETGEAKKVEIVK